MTNWEDLLRIMEIEIVPALGCTEPVAVALAVAKAKSLLENNDDLISIEILLSRNVLKNAMSVGIPGTKYVGLEYAAALGAFGGNHVLGLEVFKDITELDIGRAEVFIRKNGVKISHKNVDDNIYIEAILKTHCNEATVTIKGTHTNIVLIKKDGIILLDKDDNQVVQLEKKSESVLDTTTLQELFEFARSIPIEKLDFLLEAIELNVAISEEGLINQYGLGLGKKLLENMDKGILGKDYCNDAVMRCVSAVDARMAGCKLPVMSNSGSGNQGITATVPVWAFAKALEVEQEKMIRSLALSHIVSIYIKNHMDRLSALCGAIIAAMGVSCAVTYLNGGEYKHIEIAIKNMIANISGMVCDGAKSSCSLKVFSSVQAAFHSAFLAIDGVCVTGIEGIIEQDVERSIDNLGILCKKGMKETDKVILDIMVSK